jgi:K+-sensing histidine kinase KdpD
MTYENDEPIEPYKDWTLNIEIDTSLSLKERREFFKNYVVEMANSYPPIKITVEIGGEKLITKIYYTNSDLINYLRFFPFIAMIIIGAFILVGYMAFSNIRKSEESKVWVGMAKEAAHQLGTPLSSLLAWLEIAKLNKDDATSFQETLLEMQNDLDRLLKITTRFSKIGSLPEKKVENIAKVIDDVCIYFERRLPHLEKKIEIKRKNDIIVYAEINDDLIAWVIENLLKNSAEAIEDKDGYIEININPYLKKKVTISIKDNGKGMTKKQKSQIFYPGFTTKKRGWGLGLSLCKRIIEDYHQGKIYVSETMIGKGTTFIIELPKITERK